MECICQARALLRFRILRRHCAQYRSFTAPLAEGVDCPCSLGVQEVLWEALPVKAVHLQTVLCWTRAMPQAVLCLKVRGVAQYTMCIINE